MKYSLPINLPTGPVLIVGKPSSFQSTIALTFAGQRFAKGNTDIVWCTYSNTDGQEHIAEMRNWLNEMEANVSRKDIELNLHYIDNADAMKAKQLTDKIASITRMGHLIVIRDTSREFGDAQNHWHTFHGDILARQRCTILHVAKTDVMGANGPDESKYKTVWRVSPYRASLHDQLNECVRVDRTSNGQPQTPWIFREHPGTAARIWKLSDEEFVAA
jgi:hypothetical protein